MPGVEDVHIVSQEEVEKLIEPWLGARTGEDQIPVPALVDVRLRDPVDGEKLGAIRSQVRSVAPAARVDAQSTWLTPVFAAIDSLQWLAFTLVALLAYIAFTITVTNTGRVPVQLISRHWVIQDERGHSEEVKGLGVVGQQPLLRPGESFQYTSGCRLRAASGTMHGSYFFVAEDGHRFDAPIGTFVLDASNAIPGGRTLH